MGARDVTMDVIDGLVIVLVLGVPLAVLVGRAATTWWLHRAVRRMRGFPGSEGPIEQPRRVGAPR